jgi:hypothetical protein
MPRYLHSIKMVHLSSFGKTGDVGGNLISTGKFPVACYVSAFALWGNKNTPFYEVKGEPKRESLLRGFLFL